MASFTDKATADPIGNSYFKVAHQNGNIDVVFPKPPSECELSTTCTIRNDFDSINSKEMLNLISICPELKHSLVKQIQQAEYTSTHELCPLQQNIIGKDSSDGKTWTDERG